MERGPGAGGISEFGPARTLVGLETGRTAEGGRGGEEKGWEVHEMAGRLEE